MRAIAIALLLAGCNPFAPATCGGWGQVPSDFCDPEFYCYSIEARCTDHGWMCVIKEPIPNACEWYPNVCGACPGDLAAADLAPDDLGVDMSAPLDLPQPRDFGATD
jgi:hypothetical protein